MWQVASRRENRHMEIGLERAEAAELFHGCGRSFLAPDQQCRLAEAAKGALDVDVELAGDESSWCVPSSALV